MNLLFRVVYAAHANGTHHKLALDALRYLRSNDAPAWRALFLKHVEVYLEGSKAPDKEFKDFKNHVLHVRDGFWGGAPEKVESWYQLLVRALREKNFAEAVWCAGVLSHYYTDPIHPFHTAQSEAESNIHRAVEWSISKSYGELRRIGLDQGMPTFEPGASDAWLKDMVIAGAELANQDYETLIAHYDFDAGVVDPPAGLDETCKRCVGRLLVYASSGFAEILDSAIAEAAVEPPEVSLTLDTVLATLQIPVKWVTRKMTDAAEAREVERMYDELQSTGSVDATLSEDDRAIRDLHASEVLAPASEQRQEQRRKRREASPLPQGNVARPVLAPPLPGKGAAAKSSAAAVAGSSAAAKADSAPTLAGADHKLRTSIVQPTMPQAPEVGVAARQEAEAPLQQHTPEKHSLEEKPSRQQAPQQEAPQHQSRQQPEKRYYLELDDDVEAAPSIGPKTAARLQAVRIVTVNDLLAADPDELAGDLDTRHIRPATIRDWQDQSRLMLAIPGLRVSHSQIFVGAGYRNADEIALADPAEVMSAMLRFASTHEGQRILGRGTAPDMEAVTAWIEAAEEALAA